MPRVLWSFHFTTFFFSFPVERGSVGGEISTLLTFPSGSHLLPPAIGSSQISLLPETKTAGDRC